VDEIDGPAILRVAPASGAGEAAALPQKRRRPSHALLGLCGLALLLVAWWVATDLLADPEGFAQDFSDWLPDARRFVAEWLDGCGRIGPVGGA